MISEATDFLQTERLSEPDFLNHELVSVRNDLRLLQTQMQSLLDRVSIIEEKLAPTGAQMQQSEKDQSPVTESSLASEMLADFQESVLDGLRNEVLNAELIPSVEPPTGRCPGEADVIDASGELLEHVALPPNEAEVDSLKRMLHEQLRDAEVEMALERARVFQQRAALEEMKIKMAHDASSSSIPNENPDPESRLQRHIDYLRSFQ